MYTTKDIVDHFADPFRVESTRLDEKAHVVKGICIASTRKSKNNYEYSDQSFNTLTRMVNEGANMYFDHPSKDSIKATDGVRSVLGWGGVFRNAKRTGDKITADLHVAESAWPIMKSIVELNPPRIGCSINSRVRTFKDEKGMEHVHDIDSLKSVDIVSSPALVSQGLWESTHETRNDYSSLTLEGLVKHAPHVVEEVKTKMGFKNRTEGHRAHKADLSHLDDLLEGENDLIESLKAGAWEDIGTDYSKVTIPGLFRQRPDLIEQWDKAMLGALEEHGIYFGDDEDIDLDSLSNPHDQEVIQSVKESVLGIEKDVTVSDAKEAFLRNLGR
jgi:hypothetical protein